MKIRAFVDAPTSDQINSAAVVNLGDVPRMSSEVSIYNSTPGAAVAVFHDLNAVADMLFVTPKIDARWWVDADDRAAWSSSMVLFHASHAGEYLVRVACL